MARARGRAVRAVLAGTIVCWAVAEGAAVAQEAAEVTEDLGNSYLLARRTTSLGSIIETVLFAGEPIVTEIVVPAGDAGTTANTTRAVAQTPADSASALPSDAAAALPPSIGSGFGGTWLSGEIIDDYLILHRIRASTPVTHDVFRHGRKLGSVTEVGPPIRAGRSAGRNSFAFESTDDRFIVHLTQQDGTRIQATTEHGRFLDQVVERSAALPIPPHTGAPGAVPSGRPAEAVALSTGRSPEPQRPKLPQDAGGSVRVEEPTPPVALTQPDAVPLPHPSIRATPTRTASPSLVEDLVRSASKAMTGAPAVRLKPATTSGDRPPPAGVTKPRPIAPASATTAEAARAKPVADAPPSSASPAARSVAPASSCYYPGIRVPPVWDSSRSMWVEVGACEYPPAEPGASRVAPLKAADWSR
jgi:hypothetical protein